MERLIALFDHTSEGILISDSEGEIIYANPILHEIFGYQKKELEGRNINELIPERFSHKHKEHISTFKKTPKARPMGRNQSFFGIKKNGTEFPLEISLSHYTKDSKLYVISFIIDITERKQYEESINNLNKELEIKVHERTKVLERSLAELEHSKKLLVEALYKEKELNTMKSRFVTMASHEFRTPLSTILSSLTLLEKYHTANDTEKHNKHINRVKFAVANMTLILNDLLTTEKLNEGVIKAERTEFSLRDLTNETIAEMHSLLSEGQEIICSYEGNDHVNLDKPMIKNILLSLISNAIKFSGKDKKIEISINASPKTTTIKVSDEGIGIPKEEQEHIFERFFRARNVTNIQGTGLGLSLTEKYLELMKGKISFSSELNKGTTFIVTIPTV